MIHTIQIDKFKNATKFDLDGKTLIPGFIEPHLHPSLAAIMLQIEIIAPYDWKLPSGTKNKEDIDAAINAILKIGSELALLNSELLTTSL